MKKRSLSIAACGVILVVGSVSVLASLTGTRVKTSFNSVSNTLPDGLDPAGSAASFDETGTAADASLALGGGQANGEPSVATANRKIIRNADVQLTAKDIAKAVNDIGKAMERSGGYLANQESSFDGASSATMEFRVPSRSFDRALEGLSTIGKINSTRITSSEVTAKFVDLESRLKTLRSATERIRKLLETASRKEIIELEQELSKREAELASLQGQLNVLSDQVELSRITVTVYQTAPAAPAAPAPVKKKSASFSSAFDGSVRVLETIGAALVIAAGAILPFLPFVLLGSLSSWAFVRLRRRRQLATARPVRSGTTATPAHEPSADQETDDRVSV